MSVSFGTGSRIIEPELVSVVIPTWNSGDTLERCLRSLTDQTYKNYEFVVVDRNSWDDTTKIAGRYAEVLQCDAERSKARNLGAEHSRGGFLLFVDSDMTADPSLVQECVGLARGGCDAVIITEQTIGDSFLARARALERSRNYNSTLYEAARFLTKDSFNTAGRYSSDLVGFEDFDLQARLEKKGFTIGRASGYLYHWEDKLTLGHHLRKKKAYVRAARRYLGLNPERALKQLFPTKLLGAVRDLDSWRKAHLLVGLGFLKTLEIVVCIPEFLKHERAQ